MYLMKIGSLTLAIGLICAGCASTTNSSAPNQTTYKAPEIIQQRPQPEWVTGESSDYPRLSYITIRASADSNDAADSLASDKLSKLFAVNLVQYGISAEQAMKTANYQPVAALSDGKQRWVASTDITRVLESIKIVDHWYDTATGTHYALAVIARNTGEGYLRQQIQGLDALTEDYIRQARSDSDPLTQVGLLAKAWRAQQIRAALQSSMRSADLTARGIAPRWNITQFEKDCLGLLTGLKIYPTGLKDELNAQRVTAILSGALIVADLTPASEAEADYVLRATLDVSIAGAQDRWALGHGVIKLVLADNATGKVRGSKQLEIETPGLDENAAQRRVAEKSEYLMKVEMRNLLLDMAM